ncbi:gag-pol [Trichonephila clavipes]|nr:gag-pol [Trichonephila clavipes]
MAPRQNLRRSRITCWECGGAGHLRNSYPRINNEDRNVKCWCCDGTGHARSNFPRVNQEYPHRASVIESMKVCSHRKGSEDENINSLLRRPGSENSKYSWRVEKKFGVIDPEVRQVTTPPTSESDPWSDESVRKDQRADPGIKQL